MTLLRDLQAELSLWEKICLLAKIYFRNVYDWLLGCARWGYSFSPSRAMAETELLPLGKWYKSSITREEQLKLPGGERWNYFASLDGKYVDMHQLAWQRAIAIELGDPQFDLYCTQEELDHWYIEDISSGDPNPEAVAQTLKNRGRYWAKSPVIPSYYVGEVPSSNYFVGVPK